MSDVWRKLQESNRAVGVGRGEDRFYAQFALERRSGSEFLVEVTFNPEIVEIDGVETDVIVYWNSLPHVRDWVNTFARDVSFELASEEMEAEMFRRYF